MKRLALVLAAISYLAMTPALAQTSFLGSKHFHAATSSTAQDVGVDGRVTSLAGYAINNGTGATCYLQVFDKALANVTVGTTAPDYVIQIPTTASANVGFSYPISFGAGMVIASTTSATGSSSCVMDVSLAYIQ